MEKRAAGLLLHPTSLPSRFGIGDFGPEAVRFLDWAARAGQSWWQILPLGPPDSGASPYSCLSSAAGNPLLISPQLLLQQNLLDPGDLDSPPSFPADRVAFEEVSAWKEDLLRRAWKLFQHRASEDLNQSLDSFCNEHSSWIDDWALFAALRARHDFRGWWEWDNALMRREEAALAAARQKESGEIAFHRFVQWLVFEQWSRLHQEARQRGIRVLGDLPIYVSWNSVEVWTRPDLFELDDQGFPIAVAGVPPDDYSDTGQRWGNPLYRWERMAEEGYAWWVTRLSAVLATCDRVRLDHFRGFAGYWRVPAEHPTAEHGTWVDGPGLAFFDALRQAFGDLPLLAEDLGVITPEVEALRRDAGLPGIKVLQFAFGESNADHAPHRFEPASVVYTGTHDNDTTVGWYGGLDPKARRRVRRYSGAGAPDIHHAFIRLAYTSVANLAIVPVQDVLGLGGDARMNTPGQAEGNWAWRLDGSLLRPELAKRLKKLVKLTGRLPERPETAG